MLPRRNLAVIKFIAGKSRFNWRECAALFKQHQDEADDSEFFAIGKRPLGNGTDHSERPESDEEIYALYVTAMKKLGVDVEAVPALKNKSANDMWNMVCNAGLQERDDRNTPEFFANTLMNESKNSHLNAAF